MSEFAVTREVTISAPAEKVWRALTDVTLMPQWMTETGMEIVTDWQVGHAIIMQGHWHKLRYKNVGTVLQFDPGRVLSYSHLSSISRLPDVKENHAVLTFNLSTAGQTTRVSLTLSHSPTYTIHKHLEFYWNVTLDELRKFVEHQFPE